MGQDSKSPGRLPPLALGIVGNPATFKITREVYGIRLSEGQHTVVYADRGKAEQVAATLPQATVEPYIAELINNRALARLPSGDIFEYDKESASS